MIPPRKQAESALAAATSVHLDALAERDKMRQRHAEEQAAAHATISAAESALNRARVLVAIAKFNPDALASLRADTPDGPGTVSLQRAGLAEREAYSYFGTTHKRAATWTALGRLAREVLAELETPVEAP